MPELIVTARELRYAGKTHLNGARFDASEKDARVLKAIGKADDAPPAPTPVRKVAETVAPPAPVETTEPKSEQDLLAPPVARSFPYRTRRLKAED